MKTPPSTTIFALLFLVLLCLTSLQCGSSGAQGRADKGGLSILAYNVQALFDDKDDGTEFSEYSIEKGTWDSARYATRIQNTGQAILAASQENGSYPGPDIVCLEEIENPAVLDALRKGPLKHAAYDYWIVAPKLKGAFSVAMLSRVPIKSVQALRFDNAVASTGGQGFSGEGETRAFLYAQLEIAPTVILHLLACHWKSKVGGGSETEEQRRQAAQMISNKVASILEADAAALVVVCGDFNESPDEYHRIARAYPTGLCQVEDLATINRPHSRLLISSSPTVAGKRGDEVVLFSPWGKSSGYSYYFDGEGERIDGFLLSKGLVENNALKYSDFRVIDNDFLLDESGFPKGWKSQSGFSDHLPILLFLSVGNPPKSGYAEK